MIEGFPEALQRNAVAGRGARRSNVLDQEIGRCSHSHHYFGRRRNVCKAAVGKADDIGGVEKIDLIEADSRARLEQHPLMELRRAMFLPDPLGR